MSIDTSAIPIPEDALELALTAYDGARPGVPGVPPALEAAIQAALRAMGFRQEWAVPCLDRDNCRTLAKSREHAEELARTEGGVIEGRISQPWRPV